MTRLRTIQVKVEYRQDTYQVTAQDLFQDGSVGELKLVAETDDIVEAYFQAWVAKRIDIFDVSTWNKERVDNLRYKIRRHLENAGLMSQ